MRHLIVLGIYLGAFALLSACSPDSSEIKAQMPVQEQAQPQIPVYDKVAPQEFKWISEDGGNSQFDFNPQVDILFVMDNSDSMKSAQENLKKNIDRFTAGFVKNKMIDYHVGVVATWDSSERFIKTKKDSYGIGELRYVKDLTGKSVNERFFTKADAGKNSLASTLAIGVAPYAEGGPENEEFYSPIAAALEKTGRGAVNEGFFRDNAQLVIVIMTDADDSVTNLTSDQMAKTLFDFKGGDENKVSLYGVLVRASDPDQYKDWGLRIHPKYHEECFDFSGKTPKRIADKCLTGFGPDRLDDFILKTNASSGTPDQIRAKFIKSILSKDYGKDLAQIGSDITVKTLEKDIYLSQRPRVNDKGQLMVRVRYGTDKELAAGKGQIIPQTADGGWLYDPENNLVHLSGKIDYSYKEGARFAVDLIPLTLKQ